MPTDNADADAREALDALLSVEERTGTIEDFAEVASRSWAVRLANTRHGGAAIARLRAAGWSWREIEHRTSIPTRTARRWSKRPD